jgi:hypothetical protein
LGEYAFQSIGCNFLLYHLLQITAHPLVRTTYHHETEPLTEAGSVIDRKKQNGTANNKEMLLSDTLGNMSNEINFHNC